MQVRSPCVACFCCVVVFVQLACCKDTCLHCRKLWLDVWFSLSLYMYYDTYTTTPWYIYIYIYICVHTQTVIRYACLYSCTKNFRTTRKDSLAMQSSVSATGMGEQAVACAKAIQCLLCHHSSRLEYTYIYTHLHVYIHIHIYMYIYICASISACPLRAARLRGSPTEFHSSTISFSSPSIYKPISWSFSRNVTWRYFLAA